MIAPLPHNEAARLEALQAYEILDTEPENELDLMAAEMAGLLNAPIAIIGFIDQDRHWFKAKYGTDLKDNRREWATCAHTIYQAKPLIAADTRLEPRFADMPPLEQVGIRAYAGVPIITPEGCAIGTVCVFDRRVRGFSELEVQHLQAFAQQVLDYLETRRLLQASQGIEIAVQTLTESQPSSEVKTKLLNQIRALVMPQAQTRVERLSQNRIRIVIEDKKAQTMLWQLWAMTPLDVTPHPIQRFDTFILETEVPAQARVLLVSVEPREKVLSHPSRVVAVLPLAGQEN